MHEDAKSFQAIFDFLTQQPNLSGLHKRQQDLAVTVDDGSHMEHHMQPAVPNVAQAMLRFSFCLKKTMNA